MTSEKNHLVEPEPGKDRLVDPSDLRELLPEAILSFFSHSGPQQNPVAEKITTENISQIIEARSNETNQEYNDRRHSRQMGALYLFLILLAGGIITVVFVFSGNESVASQLIGQVVVAIGGAGAGYGFSEWRHRRRE